MGTLNSTPQPQSRQCRDEVSRKRFGAWGKSRVEMLPSLSFFPTTLLLISQTVASLERVLRGFYPQLTFLLSNNQPNQPNQLLLQTHRDQTTNRPRSRLQFARQKPEREEPRPSWTKRGIGDLDDKPPPWSARQAAKQPDSRPPFFLPAPQLASRPLDFPLRQPIFERDPLHLPPPPPTPSLRRALKWPPWPPDPHSAQMVPLPTNNRWGYAEGWEHAEPGGTRLDQSLADRALARIELRLAQSYPRHSQRVDIDQSPEQVGRSPPQDLPSSQETRTQGGKTGPPLYAALPGGRPAPPRSMPRPLLRLKGGLADTSSNERA